MLTQHMPRRLPIAGLIIAVVALLGIGIVVWLWGGRASAVDTAAAPAAAPAVTQINEDGSVTIKVTPQPRSDGLAFTVVMDTHVVDLDGYDLRALATLRIGNAELQPSGWDAPLGGHHRQGTLTFPAAAVDGPLELIIRGVANVPERVFRWQ